MRDAGPDLFAGWPMWSRRFMRLIGRVSNNMLGLAQLDTYSAILLHLGSTASVDSPVTSYCLTAHFAAGLQGALNDPFGASPGDVRGKIRG
jgi:hypothetical protein